MLNQNLLLTGDDGYNLTNSLRFRSSASAWLNRTPASSSNLNTWTISWWTKRGQLSTPAQTTMFGTDYAASQEFMLQFTANNRFVFEQYAAGGVVVLGSLITTQVFRDPSAWYHFVVTWDSTQATAANRIKIYVNGVQITAFDTAVYPSQNASSVWNQATNQHRIGQYSTAKYYDGYMGETHFIDGQALTPSSFGETDVLTGVWKPKKFAGTYGTNGFYLPFTDNSALTTSSNVGLGKDYSGNGNYWTTNNISITAGVTYDSMTDVPTLTSATTANYCVLTPLAPITGSVLSNGNLTTTYASSSAGQNSYGTIEIPTTGQWYWEIVSSSMPANQVIGIWSSANYNTNTDAGCLGYISNGQKSNAGTNTSYGASFTTGDVIGVAFDAGAGTLTFYKNNTSQGTAFSSITGSYFAGMRHTNNSGTSTVNFNFGQRPFAYTPPTGFVALNTFNLPEPSIKAGNKQMDVSLWTGNGTSQSITNSGSMQPDFVWLKSRSSGTNFHNLYDSIRGATKYLFSNTTSAEGTNAQALTAFNTNGFSVGNDNDVNQSSGSYVGWQWKANGAAVTNTAGSISAQVSANPTAGFSIVTYTGTGVTGTLGHGLGIAPAMIIVKSRSNASNWYTYHKSIGNTGAVALNLTNATITSANFWNNTSPTSSVFTASAGSAEINGNGLTYVAYCWSEVAGYSKFGSYTGNGSTDGPFVYLGFRPKFVMIKRTDGGTANWYVLDSARSTYNLATNMLFPNLSSGETTTAEDNQDFLSNGFKVRTSNQESNINGGTYIYMAFAENPFKNALAR